MATRTAHPTHTPRSWAALLVVAACGAPTAPSDAMHLAVARGRWENFSHRNAYFFDFSRSCFCGYPGALPLTRVVVFNGQIAQAYDPATGEDLSGEARASLPTVDGLFDLIAEAIASGADEVRVRYDQSSGIPLEIRIDRIRQAVDDELSIETSNFGVVVINAPHSRLP